MKQCRRLEVDSNTTLAGSNNFNPDWLSGASESPVSQSEIEAPCSDTVGPYSRGQALAQIREEHYGERKIRVICQNRNHKDRDGNHATRLSPSSEDSEKGPVAISYSIPSQSGLVGWTGDNDSENPHNFHQLLKAFIGFVVGMMNFIVSFAISVLSGVLTEAGQEMDVDANSMQLAVSMFILGLAIGPAFFGPASEFYGRKRPLIAGMIGFMAFNICIPALKDVSAVLICRLLAGACGSAAYVIPPGVFVDLYGPVGRAIGYSVFATGAFVGGSLGPAVGASLVLHFELDWRWTVWLTVIVALPLTVVMCFLPESLESVILQRRAQRVRQETGDWYIHCTRDEVPVDLRVYLIKPWTMMFKEPVLVVVALAFTLDYCIQSLTYCAIPTALVRSRQCQDQPAAWALSFTIIGFVLGSIVIVLDTKLRFSKQLQQGSRVLPEKRLPPIIAGMTVLSLGLVCFAWKSSADIPWHEQALAEVLIGAGMYLVWVTATVYVQDLYLGHANSALAACAFIRYGIGAVFPMVGAAMYNKLGVQWTIALLGILSAALVPLHVLFYLHGKALRDLSRYASNECQTST